MVVESGAEEEKKDGEAANGGTVFQFSKISFLVKDKKAETGTKKILDDISATVCSGRVLAIMGPSGAGKTTLINALTLQGFGGTTTGSVTLDGAPMSPSLFSSRCFVVPQQDQHWPFLTCRQTMMYTAELFRGGTAASRDELVAQILTKMGLDSCADTIVGNEFVQGMSGGQKRRLSIAAALIKEPKLIFLDEPTSGLDAAAAAAIMSFITELAAQEDLAIVATIHQPSTKVYDGFDQVMLLSGGREAFCGASRDAIGYFEGIGHAMPRHTNPAEFLLDLVNADFTPKAEVDKILDAWRDHIAAGAAVLSPKTAAAVAAAQGAKGAAPAAAGVGPLAQVAVMLRRHGYLVVKDPVLYLGRALVFINSSIYFAIVYLKARDLDQDNVLSRAWLTVWYIGVPANMGVVAVFALNAEFRSIRREIKNGMISPAAYLIAKGLLEIPIMLLFAVCALGPAAYGISNYEPSGFVSVCAVWAACIYACEAVSEVLSVQFDNPLLGMMNFMGFWFSGFLYGGFLIPGKDMIWPLKIFYYILPLKYGVRSMVYAEFIDADWSKCKTFADTGAPKGLCFGEDGADILDNLADYGFPSASSSDTVAGDILRCLAIAAVAKVGYFVLLTIKSTQASKVVASAPASS